MAVATMKARKYAAVEVPAALTLDECWQLVKTHESTGVPCMMLENWSFRRDNLAVLNIIRAGLLGEIVHCHCAHTHNCIDHWFFTPEGEIRWGGQFLVKHNGSQYTTHALGPVLSWMDINCGDSFATVTSVATRSLGINRQLAKKLPANHRNVTRKYAQGDIVTSIVKTKKGNSIVINYDMQLWRPYDNQWEIQGTDGVYNEGRNSIYIHDRSPRYEEWEPFAPYQEKFDHPWWKQVHGITGGHGGADYLELKLFLDAVRNKTQTPLDVYDSVTMSMVMPLSEKSIRKGGKPVTCPDFTRGRWQTRKPSFAIT
jgi:predicted dehydrogenase